MKRDLHTAIRKALAGASNKQPVGTAKLHKLGTRQQVEAALLAMYQANEACCCKIIKDGRETIVWWLAGAAWVPLGHSRMCVGKRRTA